MGELTRPFLHMESYAADGAVWRRRRRIMQNAITPRRRHKPTTPPTTPPTMAPVFDFLDFEGALAGVATAVADGPPVDSGAEAAACAAAGSKVLLVSTSRYAQAGTAVFAGIVSVNFRE